MFYSYDHSSVRLTGRWSLSGGNACATAPGSYFEIAFGGRDIVLRFNTEWSEHPYGHIWLSLDSGALFESVIEPFVHVRAADDGAHTLKVIYKSSVEMFHRWHEPLVGKISFTGYEARQAGVLEKDERKTIEFIGDSITEGVLIEENRMPDNNNGQFNRPFQDDVTSTYAWLTAQKLNLRPLFMGYGAVGLTKGGCGGVPEAGEAYDFCYERAPVNYPSPDYIFINHGANDRGANADYYIKKYEALLEKIRKKHPAAEIIALGAFCGAFSVELPVFIEKYNKAHGSRVFFIPSNGWVPLEPLHPDAGGHRVIAEKLTAILKEKYFPGEGCDVC